MLAGLVAIEKRVWPEEVTGNHNKKKSVAERGQGETVVLSTHARLATFSELKILFYNRVSSSSSCLRENEVCCMVPRSEAQEVNSCRLAEYPGSFYCAAER